jgi:hypothetical protein
MKDANETRSANNPPVDMIWWKLPDRSIDPTVTVVLRTIDPKYARLYAKQRGEEPDLMRELEAREVCEDCGEHEGEHGPVDLC